MTKGYKVNGRIWVETEDGVQFGGGRIVLLMNIKETGSITEAAKRMKLSYRQAWELINTMNAQSKTPIVIRVTGGKGGGGTVLTEEGEKIIKTFAMVEAKFKKFLLKNA